MVLSRRAQAFGLAALVLGLATPAAAQFDAQHDHLKCYAIRGAALATKVQTDNQFGREMIVKLVPAFLCAPTQKTCLATDGSCGRPGAPSGDPVRHFKCYKIAAKECPNGDCSKLTGKFPRVTADLLDQFGTEHVTVGVPKLLCAPVDKTISGVTTTTTSTTTTTLPCRFDQTTNVCAGDCPSGFFCGTMNADPGQCHCWAQSALCQAPATCPGGACPGPNPFQICNTNPTTNVCECYQPCGADPTTCSGVCAPTASGVPRTCATGGAARCQCCIAANGPCFSGTDCCTGVCTSGNTCQ